MALSVQEELEIRKTGPFTYESVRPLQKPHPSVRGAYGGNIAGQAILVAIRSCKPGFTPHSFHLFFVKAIADDEPVQWHVTEVSNGKNFVNRFITGLQKGGVAYTANVSLAKKNLLKAATSEYEKSFKLADEEDRNELTKPFGFQTPYPESLKGLDPDKMEYKPVFGTPHAYHLLPPEMYDLLLTTEEEKLPVSQRRLAYFFRWGNGAADPVVLLDPAFQYVGLGVLSDTLFLTRMGRLLRLEGYDLRDPAPYMWVSLDHSIYFHDADFDVTKWMLFAWTAPRLANNRVLLEAEIYDVNGVHVALIMQEGLLQLNGLEREAKL